MYTVTGAGPGQSWEFTPGLLCGWQEPSYPGVIAASPALHQQKAEIRKQTQVL